MFKHPNSGFTLWELISHDLKQAAFRLFQKQWREPMAYRLRACGRYLHSAFVRPYYHWRN